MPENHVIETVNRILIEEFELDAKAVRPEANLFEELELDSLDAVDLVAALEDAFGGRVNEDEARQVRTVSDIYGLVERTIAAAGASGSTTESAESP